MTEDMHSVAEWIDENELILNLKKGNTETLLFGTAQRIAKTDESLSVKYKNTIINTTNEYKYLGVEIEGSLNLNSHFDKCYKRAAGRLRLLAKLRTYLNVVSAKAIYDSMILATFTYCGILTP